MHSFNVVEQKFEDLLSGLSTTFSERETKEVRHFLDVNEYGLALETVCDILCEEKKKVSSIVVTSITELTKVLELKDRLLTKLSAIAIDDS